MTEWKEFRLGEVCEIFDGPHATPPKQDEGNIFLGISSLGFDGRIDPSFFEYVSDESYKKWTKRVTPRYEDIVFSYETKLGTAAIIPNEFKCCLGRRMGLLRPKSAVVPKFLLYAYLAPKFQGVISERTYTGSTVDRIPLKEMGDFPIAFPSLPEQKAIASVLSSLDDKIDLLHRQNKTLEAMAETLFRQWFVEEGTKLCNIADFVEFNPQRQLAKNSIAPYLEMANVSTSVFHPENWYDREFKSGTKFINGDTLFARIASCLENGKSTFVTFLNEGQTGWGSTEYIVLRSKKELHPMFTYALARNDDFRGYAEGCLEGSSGRQRVNIDHLMNYELYRPDDDKIEAFNNIAKTIVPKLHKNFRQVRLLERLRDTLLPKLMSGEVRITG